MKIQILGPGCANCQRLYAQAQMALAETGLEADLVKVESRPEIEAFGIWVTPGIAIDGEVKASGRVASAEEIAAWITEASQGT